MYILGISAFYHDSAACLLKDGKIISAAQEERFTRKKHDSAFPINAIRFCLQNEGIGEKELDLISFYDKPYLKFDRILKNYLAHAPYGIKSFLESIPVWLKNKLWTKELINSYFLYDKEIIFHEHHESHAASAFYPSPFQEAAFLTLDGVGEWATSSYGVGKGNELKILSEIKYPHSLGLLYSAFTYYSGFKVNSGEYKLMGLAPYGIPKYKDIIYNNIIDLKDDGSFRLNMKYFNYCTGLTMINENFNKLFGGPPRKPESELTQKQMDLARSIQEVTEEVVLKMAKHVRTETGLNNLCLSGGVALNCVANGKLIKEKIFKNIWIQPAAGDAGGSIGSALLTWQRYLGNGRKVVSKNDSMNGAFLGPSYNDKDIQKFLKKNKVKFTKYSKEELVENVVDFLSKGKVIGWFQGRMEFGPRALGGRTIIGDARSDKMQKIMNLKIKYRESFRPFAPSVLEEHVSDWFDLDRKSPYMLIVADVLKKHRLKENGDNVSLFGIDKLNLTRSIIPAVTHIDYSARIQTVSKTTNPLYHQLLSRFNEKYGCPVLVNTSFNVRGEPIVCSLKDAWLCFMRTEMDFLAIGNYIIAKNEQTAIVDDENWEKQYQLD